MLKNYHLGPPRLLTHHHLEPPLLQRLRQQWRSEAAMRPTRAHHHKQRHRPAGSYSARRFQPWRHAAPVAQGTRPQPPPPHPNPTPRRCARPLLHPPDRARQRATGGAPAPPSRRSWPRRLQCLLRLGWPRRCPGPPAHGLDSEPLAAALRGGCQRSR